MTIKEIKIKKIILIIIIVTLFFLYLSWPVPKINPYYIAIFNCNIVIPFLPPLGTDDKKSATIIIYQKGDIYGTVNLIHETESAYYLQYVNRLTKRIGYRWFSKQIIKLEKID